MKLLFCTLIIVMATMADQNSTQEYLKNAVGKFTAQFGFEVTRQHPAESVVYSASSLMPLLGLLGLASAGSTHEEILKTIGLPNDDVVKEVFSSMSNNFRSIKGVTLKMASKVYISDGLELNDKFAADAEKFFDSEVQNLDFNQAEKSATEINKWVESHTNNLIKDLVEKDSINSDTVAMLVNAIYFKGNWKEKFNVNRTMNRDFFVSKDKTVQVPMMFKSGDFLYGESTELDAKLLEIPYEGDEASFLIILPNRIDGLPEIERKLSEKTLLDKAESDMISTEVEVFIPKFKIETQIDLKEALENMNMKSVFNPATAQIPNLLKSNETLFVSKGIQKAFIEVNEEGSEAAAANAFGIQYLSAIISDTRIFNADHPFKFYLKEKDNILFSGNYMA